MNEQMKFGNNDNLERFIVNNLDPTKDEIVGKYIDKYLKAWGDPKNTYQDNVFLQEEALREAKNDPDLVAAHKKAMIKFYAKEAVKEKEGEDLNESDRLEKIKKLKNIVARNDRSDTVVTAEGIVTERQDILSGEKEQL